MGVTMNDVNNNEQKRRRGWGEGVRAAAPFAPPYRSAPAKDPEKELEDIIMQ